MKTLSIIVPIYKDGILSEDFCKTLQGPELVSSLNGLGISRTEVIFVSDGIEADLEPLKRCCDRYEFAKLVALSRNFGQHIAISCGLKHATGDFAAYTDVDMEDPLDQLPLVLQKMKDTSAELCVGLRQERKVSWLKNLSSQIFHILLTKLTGLSNPRNCTTMRVMTRKYLDSYLMINEKERYLPAMEIWLGHKISYLPIIQNQRQHGESSYNFRKKVRLALTAVLSFSDTPLRITVKVGFFISFVSFLMGLYLVITKLFLVDYQPGFTATTTLILFLGGFQILVTGLAGLYIGHILKEVQDRPLYIIKEKYKI